VPRRDCSALCGRAPTGNGPRGDHHAARRVAQQEKDVARERSLEAPARLDRRSHDDELGPPLGGDARNFFAEAPGTGAHDLPPDADAVRGRHRGGAVEPLLQARERAVHVRVQRQLALDDERPDEDDPGSAVGGEATGEVERMLRLVLVEQRHDDAAIGDRARPAREAPRAPVERSQVERLHRISW
jgi:hypothetical protein